MSRVTVDANRAMYEWAITRARLDVADLERRFPKLREWTSGGARPTLKQLETFALATHAPVGYFFLEEPPREAVPIPDFRTVRDEPLQQPSADLLDTIYVCQRRQDWYGNFARSEGEGPLPFVGSVQEGADVVATAEAIRVAIGFDVDERERLGSWEKALRRFIELVEDAGILLMVSGIVLNNTHRKLDPEEFRGFTLADPFAPVVFVNGSDTKSAQMFTLAHELAHVWAGQSALSNAPAREIQARSAERWCNSIAAELLVPVAVMRIAFDPAADREAEVPRLARRFKVSTLVILRRIYDVGGFTREEFWAAYDAEVERLRDLGATGSGGGDFHNNEAIRVGRRFGTALVASTLAGDTLYRDAFRMLGFWKTETLHSFGRSLGLSI